MSDRRFIPLYSVGTTKKDDFRRGTYHLCGPEARVPGCRLDEGSLPCLVVRSRYGDEKDDFRRGTYHLCGPEERVPRRGTHHLCGREAGVPRRGTHHLCGREAGVPRCGTHHLCGWEARVPRCGMHHPCGPEERVPRRGRHHFNCVPIRRIVSRRSSSAAPCPIFFCDRIGRIGSKTYACCFCSILVPTSRFATLLLLKIAGQNERNAHDKTTTAAPYSVSGT